MNCSATWPDVFHVVLSLLNFMSSSVHKISHPSLPGVGLPLVNSSAQADLIVSDCLGVG